MIVDTSALIAILRDEPEAASFALAIAQKSTPAVFGRELCSSCGRHGRKWRSCRQPPLRRPLQEAQLVVEPVTEQQAHLPARPTGISAKAAVIRPA